MTPEQKVIELAKQMGISISPDNPTPKGADPATWAKLDLDEDKGVPVKSVDNLATIFENDPKYSSLCFDEHSNRLLWNNELIEDHMVQRIRRDVEVRYKLSRPSKEVADLIQMVCHANVIEPIKDYLLDLKWDGRERIQTLFEKVFKAEITEDTRAIVEAMSRKWWISCVARIMQPGCHVHSCLVMVGGKGVGKSTCMEIMASPSWFSRSDLPIGTTRASELLHASGVWCWEFSEMSSLQGKSASVTKQFLTDNKDDYRPSYARFPVCRKRRTVFCATTNDFQFLSDGTDRRFWIINIQSMIDLGYLQENRDQIWAEAVAAYKAGESWFLDNDMEKNVLPVYQQSYLVEDAWAYRVIRCIEDTPKRVSTADIMEYLELPIAQQHNGNSRRISQICRDMGFVQKKIGGKNYWSSK